MKNISIITPVKDSLHTTKDTIKAVAESTVSFPYKIYNDFSSEETKKYLTKHAKSLNYTLVNLEDITDTPSPNYKLVLQIAQKEAIENESGLLIIESDVMVRPDTIEQLFKHSQELDSCGMVASVTVDHDGNYNFPYNHVKASDPEVMDTDRSLSFCCTLITLDFLKSFDFQELSDSKDWFDVYISRKSKKLGFKNYLLRTHPVLHQPHSSRPWKQLKYDNPLKYYFLKFFKRRDRI
ncbi:glycosyltransferase family 2 protein [Prolixibacteraceae bacterium JC049]|nr:glycosyltransferase family 2 protein [Prolixibacteraceae bacterium JC049]